MDLGEIAPAEYLAVAADESFLLRYHDVTQMEKVSVTVRARRDN